jgi:tRNA threonylcarbamoyladenosine biosynthesis protein TsaB
LQNNLHYLATFLYIDTAGENAFIGLSKDSQLLALKQNRQANTHASFVQVAIHDLLKETGVQINEIDAVAVTMGPGSYTGLRVGLSSAKGIAYAIDKPLIGISTLALLAHHASKHPAVTENKVNIQIFSMIDAKRSEVFGAIYKADNTVLVPEQSIIVDQPYFEQLLKSGPVLCVGNGAIKSKEIVNKPLLFFMEESYDMEAFMHLAKLKWENKDFENVAYCKPAYLKDFYQIPSTRV